MDRTPFHISGASHWAAVVITIAAAWGFVRLLKSPGRIRLKRIAVVSLAVALFAAVAADPVITWLRYREISSAKAWEMVNETAWPFYLCDFAAVICGVALLRKSQRLAEVGWCWGMGGTLQGLVYPTSLSYDFPNPDWFAFFAEHGGVPVAAVALVFGMGLRSEPGVVWRAFYWLCGYLAIAAAANLMFVHGGGYRDSNYGFVCTSDYSPFKILGPWPVYVVGMALALGILFVLLTVPLCGKSAYNPKAVRPFLK